MTTMVVYTPYKHRCSGIEAGKAGVYFLSTVTEPLIWHAQTYQTLIVNERIYLRAFTLTSKGSRRAVYVYLVADHGVFGRLK
jgi:hypothetical protein